MTRLAMRVARLDRMLRHAAEVAACICLAVAASAASFQVVARFVLDLPSPWTEALARLSLIWMVMLGLSVTLRNRALVSVDLLPAALGGTPARLLHWTTLACVLTVLACLFWYGLDMAQRVAGQTLSGLEVSIAWGYAAIPVGAILSMIAAVSAAISPPAADIEDQL
ncbi:TRAP transporter small permease [Rhizobium laguerreae]|uniref:TRAP transporter small permease n=1 Tax=Rhizobium laguerreae TaxID=1076926 RepID=UPI001C91A0FB|nr:TRAP transporter small permease [Rhizobium laguerreae]MBY3217747.1 TRAP transporter small permease [Rhizobium laguerreae]